MVQHMWSMKSLSRWAQVLAVPLTVAWLLGLFAAGTALAWTSTCDTGEVCIYENRDFTPGEVAGVSGDVTVYQGQYPGSGVNIDNTTSALKNLKSTLDTSWYTGYDYSGGSYCYDSWTSWYWVGLGHNDAYSSHNVHTSDAFC